MLLSASSGNLGGDCLLADLNEASSSAYSCAHVNLCLFPVPCFVVLWSIQSIFHDFCVPWCGRRVRVALTKHGLESWLNVIMRRKNSLCLCLPRLAIGS
jgi:hypothetical protein